MQAAKELREDVVTTPHNPPFLLDYPAKTTLDPTSFTALAQAALFLLYRTALLTQETSLDHSTPRGLAAHLTWEAARAGRGCLVSCLPLDRN